MNARLLGAVAYVGNVHYAKGIYVGVIMDHALDGKNDGTGRYAAGCSCSVCCVRF
jgi:dynactin complex subunit